MKTTSGIFIIVLLLSATFSYTQNSFSHVERLLHNFKTTNLNEQKDADIREAKERKWCQTNIFQAKQTLFTREQDVTDLDKHITVLKHKREEAIKDRDDRKKRIKDNEKLLDKFKMERCDNNLLFVKNLRDHIEAIDVLKLLREDIVAYFKGKKPKPIEPPVAGAPLTPGPDAKKNDDVAKKPYFGQPTIEDDDEVKKEEKKDQKSSYAQIKTTALIQLSEGELKYNIAVNLVQRIAKLTKYEHLLDTNNRVILSQLQQFGGDMSYQNKIIDANNTKERTQAEIGKLHVDNTQGELKRVTTPEFQDKAEFDADTEKKILLMIDKLIQHIKDSRERITANEVRSSEDFAIFESNLNKEQAHLQNTVKQIDVEIVTLTNQINIAIPQLAKRKSLRDQAKQKLNALVLLCENKYKYFEAETNRRNQENVLINKAIALFTSLLQRSKAMRAQRRADSNFQGAKYGKADNVDKRVVNAAKGISTRLDARVKSRNEVAF